MARLFQAILQLVHRQVDSVRTELKQEGEFLGGKPDEISEDEVAAIRPLLSLSGGVGKALAMELLLGGFEAGGPSRREEWHNHFGLVPEDTLDAFVEVVQALDVEAVRTRLRELCVANWLVFQCSSEVWLRHETTKLEWVPGTVYDHYFSFTNGLRRIEAIRIRLNTVDGEVSTLPFGASSLIRALPYGFSGDDDVEVFDQVRSLWRLGTIRQIRNGMFTVQIAGTNELKMVFYSFIRRQPSSDSPQWYFQDDAGKFLPYDEEVTQLIEEAYQKREASVEVNVVKIRGMTPLQYTILLGTEMEQHGRGTKRPVLRESPPRREQPTPVAQTSFAANAEPFAAPVPLTATRSAPASLQPTAPRPCPETQFELMCGRWKDLPYKMPTEANRLSSFFTTPGSKQRAGQYALATRPLCHEAVARLLEEFRHYKVVWGSATERAVYGSRDSMLTVAGFIRRLLTKRPLMFMTECDEYVLRDGRTSGKSTVRGPSFDDIGTFREQAPLVMEDYQSYDEMEISALLGMSVPTHFINTGGRRNQGRAAPVGTCEPRGIYVGLVGSRFERRNLMEWRHMVVTRDQNTTKNGYGQGNSSAPMLLEWAKLYGLGYLPTFEEAESIAAQGSERFVNLGNGTYLDTEAYRARCELTADMFLAEANERAEAEGAKALCHVVGLGLGVWQLHGKQVQIQADAYAAAARRLSLPHVAELHFSWFDSCSACGGVPGGGRIQTQDGGKILVEFGRRDPAEKLPTPAPGERAWLLVAQYAWDGNSYPGNEYWAGMLAASGDPAAASSSCIPELQNPEVNVEAFAVENVHIVPGASSRARRTLPREPTGFDKQEAAVHIQSVARGTSERRGYPVPGATEAAGPADTRMPCKFGCGCAAAPGKTRGGRPFDTCCRDCARSRGSGRHDHGCPGPR
mmetsp:Transcript_90866/g.256674  ORF Transcript_90866/g.256674 Transcript_90866/m.256674 type:complete len:912 (+) Transcript_90866:60-2795(+)